MKETLVIIGGVACVAWVIFHILFWKIFDWKNSLSSLSHQQRSIMYILNITMAYVLSVFAYLSIVHRGPLISTSFGKVVLVSIGLFWLIRAVQQGIFGFHEKESVRRSIAIIMACFIMALLYLIPLWI